MPRDRSAAQRRRRSLDRLAQIHGIERSYTDVWRKRRVVSAASQRALLQAMGIPCEDDAEVDASLRLAERAALEEVLPPVIVTRGPKPSVAFTLPSSFARRIAWSVRTEAGPTVAGEADPHDLQVVEEVSADGVCYRRYRVELPPLVLGCHALELSVGVAATTALIVAPNRAFGVADVGESEELWGVTAPLYGLRSETNWGVGDFHDLGDLAKLCGGFGAAFVGINPIHAQYPATPARYSPYAPSSRRLLNTLLIAIDQVPELAYCDRARALLQEPAFHSLLGDTRAAEMVDYERVGRLKLEVLELLFETLRARRDGPRWLAFEAFRREAGSDLEHQALFDALSVHLQERDPDLTSWRAWPLPYQDPQSEEVAGFARTHPWRISFFAYLQWLAAEQLEQAQRRAQTAMPLGLYLDLAVGVAPDGAEAWAHRESIVEGATLGAPPDEFNHNGQNWGLAPLLPRALRARAYSPLIAILRAAMRHAGALRIDHVLGLQRSFWCPANPDVPGAYVRQPIDELLGVIALESHRQRCVVIGEDLGTVPNGLRRKLDRAGVMGCSLLYFEREASGGFRPPARYRPSTIASIGSHDLPTLVGFWEGRDIDWRERLGLYPDPGVGLEPRRLRTAERRALMTLLADEGLLPPGIDPKSPPRELPWTLVVALHRALARSPCKLVALQIEDALGAIEQANLPGTIDQHPNWRRRLSRMISEIGDMPGFVELTQAIAAERTPTATSEPDAVQSLA